MIRDLRDRAAILIEKRFESNVLKPRPIAAREDLDHHSSRRAVSGANLAH